MTRKLTTLTHYHGYLLTQNEEEFGFVRISKNGSTTISSIPEFKFRKWRSIRGFNSNIYAAVRHPVDRFLSSVPETLMRYRHPEKSGEKNKIFQDVAVSYDVYDFLNLVRVDKLDEFLFQYLDLIEGCGFFDAHHEPQTSFITDIFGSLYHDMFLFDIHNSSDALNSIAAKEGLDKINKIRKMNSGLNSRSLKSVVKEKIISKINPSAGERHPAGEESYNPLYRWSKKNNVNPLHARRTFYTEIKKMTENSCIVSRIESLYQGDMDLYKHILANTEESGLCFLSKRKLV